MEPFGSERDWNSQANRLAVRVAAAFAWIFPTFYGETCSQGAGARFFRDLAIMIPSSHNTDITNLTLYKPHTEVAHPTPHLTRGYWISSIRVVYIVKYIPPPGLQNLTTVQLSGSISINLPYGPDRGHPYTVRQGSITVVIMLEVSNFVTEIFIACN